MDYPGKVITKNQVIPTQTSATGVWTLDDAAAATRNNNWPVAGVPNPISKSLRFNPADTAYLSRTFGTPTNNKKWTMSGWMKRSAINDGNYNTLFARYVDGNNFMRVDLLGDNLRMYQYKSANDVLLRSTLVLRDPSAWYHFVVVYDSDNATSSNRVLFYINNTQITSFSSSTYPSSGSSSIWNTSGGATHQIGTFNASGVGEAFSGYMTETNFIDGQALTPSSFGMTDPVTGVWEPLKYSGTYGTNGFYLNFKDATSTTTLGLDYSGNANNWTTNNFSVTAGAGNDSLTDVPTPWIPYNTTGDVGGVFRGNYATLNPLDQSTSTITDGNLRYQASATAYSTTRATTALPSTGKWYWENIITTVNTATSENGTIGMCLSTASLTAGFNTTGFFVYSNRGDFASQFSNDGSLIYNSNTISWTTGDIIQVAIDMATGKVWFGKNNSWWTSSGGTTGNPSAGTNETITISGANLARTIVPMVQNYGTSGVTTLNFGQRPFAYTPPSGFLSLCTTNLPASTVLKGADYFNAILYTGNGSSSRSITGVGFQPDWVWAKARSAAYYNGLFDVLRSGYALYSNTTDVEDTTEQLTFGSDGFTTPNKSGDFINTNSATYVAWNWKANGAGVTNTAGSITSTVSANTTSGFSIVTYTGTGANATVGHGLGVAPSMVIVKNRTYGGAWRVYHQSIGNTKNLRLNLTNAEATDSGIWNNTSPTTTVFSVGTDADVNRSTDGMVAYCFAAISGFSAFGSYTGNGSADGPFVYLGFRPRWVLIKQTNTSSFNWCLVDTSRNTYNESNNLLFPNISDAETTTGFIDVLSNGFKARNASGYVNGSGSTYIYACFAENPFKNALAR
jgi:hypothetical protein